MSNPDYIGRFAPSPSGPLHLGSLMSAVCSYLQAKSNHGRWLVRIEDVDTPRVVEGIAAIQLKQLEAFGLEWDEQVLYQSSRLNDYQKLIKHLIQQDKIYACECTRKQLKATAASSAVGIIYPKACRIKKLQYSNHSLRLKTHQQDITFTDKVYGRQTANIQNLTSDWVIQRQDGIISYHLAMVADDALQGITEVVRGLDIMPLTPLHIDLQTYLKLSQPTYCHHPLIVEGISKLSKKDQSSAVDVDNKVDTLNLILTALGQTTIAVDDVSSFWPSAIKQWDVQLIPKTNFDLTQQSVES